MVTVVHQSLQNVNIIISAQDQDGAKMRPKKKNGLQFSPEMEKPDNGGMIIIIQLQKANNEDGTQFTQLSNNFFIIIIID